MRKFLFLFSLACGAVVCSTTTAQERPAPSPAPQPRIITGTATMGVMLPIPPAVDVDIREQPDSPIRLFIDEAIKGRMPGTPLKVRNDSGSAVAAFVMRVDVEPYGVNQMIITGPKGLAVGETKIQALPMSNYREGSAKPVVSVDYVQFTDGKTWGEDSLGRSKHVSAYLKGRSEALTRLQEMLVGHDAADVMRSVETFSSSSFAEPNVLPADRPARNIDYASRGYEEVVNILRRMPRNTDLGKDLANRLEAMSKKN